jgi:D-threo-aldose 1-dehydrogenase
MPETFEYSVSEQQAHRTLEAVFASEINFLDTAASYGDGESERRIGRVLEGLGGLPRGYVLATKADRDLATGEFSGEQMRRSVERSLRLLGLDSLQLVYLHDPEHAPYKQIISEGGPVEILQEMKSEGLIQHLGVAGGPVELMLRYVETGLFEAAITHNRYTLLDRSAEPLIEAANEAGIPILNAAPYGGGLLSKGPDTYSRYAYRQAPDETIRKGREMQKACEEHGVPLAAAALQFSTRDSRIASTIVGVSEPERVEQTVSLASIEVPRGLWRRLECIADGDG